MGMTACRIENVAIVGMLTTILALSGCGGGSGGGSGLEDGIGTDGGGTSVAGASPDDAPQPSSTTGSNGLPPADAPLDTTNAPTADFPISGTFVVDEYSPGSIGPYEGIVEIVPSPLTKTRILNGSFPRLYPDGRITYREPCGQSVSRIALADINRLSTPITPCSSEIPNEGSGPIDFRQSNLSPDGSLIAVEARSFVDSNFSYGTLVFDVTSQEVLAVWNGGYNATWTPDGRLLLATDEGLQLLDANLDNPVRIGNDVTGPVGNPDVNPDGTAIVFEFNQQIWGMNIDGSSARELVTAGARLRYPIWAPDGSLTIAYLAVPSDDKYFGVIFVADLEAGQEHALRLDSVLEFGDAYFLRTINGPLNWNP